MVDTINYLNKAKWFKSNGQWDRALQYLQRLTSEDKESAEAFMEMAQIFHEQGNLSKALFAYRKVVMLEPDRVDATVSMAIILNDLGRYEEATRLCRAMEQKVLETPQGFIESSLEREFAQDHYKLGENYYKFARFDEALFEYQKADKLFPENLEYRLKMAKCYEQKGFTLRGIQVLKELKNQHPDFLRARIELGLIYLKHGKIPEAQMEWEKVLSYDSTHREALMYLELCYNAREISLEEFPAYPQT